MNKDKPPVLSDEERMRVFIPCEACPKIRDFGTAECLDCVAKCHKEAQRDADVEWFKKQGHEAISYLEGYQQARQEIFEEIEKMENPYHEIGVGFHLNGFEVCRQKILSLLRPIKNPVGNAEF